ncbi:MAG: ParA family protein [Xenococcaceae cyanobacterium]
MSKLIAVANGKGGTGKTTTSISLAAILGKTHKTLLVDTDAPQYSASYWTKNGGDKMPFDLAQESDPNLLSQLKSVDNYEFIIVDTPPSRDSEALQAVLSNVDCIILPTQASDLDVQALISTIHTLIEPSGVTYRALLTQIDSRSINEALAAQQAFIEEQIPIFSSFIRNYKIYKNLPSKGISITDAKGQKAGEAASDYKKLAQELLSAWQ